MRYLARHIPPGLLPFRKGETARTVLHVVNHTVICAYDIGHLIVVVIIYFFRRLEQVRILHPFIEFEQRPEQRGRKGRADNQDYNDNQHEDIHYRCGCRYQVFSECLGLFKIRDIDDGYEFSGIVDNRCIKRIKTLSCYFFLIEKTLAVFIDYAVKRMGVYLRPCKGKKIQFVPGRAYKMPAGVIQIDVSMGVCRYLVH